MPLLSVRRSDIQGYGVFADENLKKGSIVMMWTINSFLCNEDEYNCAQEQGNVDVIESGVRLAGQYFLWTKGFRVENYINHDNVPNLLYHCGICFAMRDITAGEELTVDYKYILSVQDKCAFKCVKTGQIINGLDGAQSLRETSQCLMDILSAPLT